MAAEAEKAYRSAIAEARSANDSLSLAKALNNLGALLYERGRNEEALSLYKEAVLLAEKLFGPEDNTTAGVAPVALVIAVQSSGISAAVLTKVRKIGSIGRYRVFLRKAEGS